MVVTGTGTEVGKTWVAVALLNRLRASGVSVAARKPAQSFDPPADRGGAATDAELLAAATGEPPADVCPPHRWYERAWAPFMAADALGRPPFGLADVMGELTWPAGVAVGLVEGAGGARSPIGSDGFDTVDLAGALAADEVVVVADAGLGTINGVRLSVAAFVGVAPVVVVLNRFDPADDLHRRNRDWLADQAGFDVVTDLDEQAGRWVRASTAATVSTRPAPLS